MFNRLLPHGLSKEQEEGYRQFHLSTDINRARLGVILLAIPISAFTLNDNLLFNLPQSVSALAVLRMFLVALSIAAFMYLGRVKSCRSYDEIVSLTSVVLLIGAGIINVTRPPAFFVQAVITSVVVFILYLVIPNRFLHQFLLASAATVGESLIIIFVLRYSDIPVLFTILLSLAFANAIAILSSLQIHSFRQKSYEDFATSKVLQKELEQNKKHLEVLVAERTEKLKAAERLAAIGATAGMVGHDIRNPLTAITGALFLAKKELRRLPGGDTKEKLGHSLDLISSQTVYVNKIVEDLQDYARTLNPVVEDVDLNQIVQSTLSLVTIPSDIQVEYLTDGQNSKLKADLSYMKRILTNLVNNAVQAMPKGGKLTVRLTPAKGKLQITVEDTGEGIPEEAKSKLFTPLVTTKSKGQGFGLAVVKRLTEALNGTVAYESAVGKGTKFIIELPQ